MTTYVANRNMQAVVDGRMVRIKAGEEIPSFESWSETAKRANLNLGFVKRIGENKPTRATAPDQVEMVDGELRKKTATVIEDPVTEEADQDEAPVEDATIATDVVCKACGKSFKNEKAFKAHKARAHKDQ